MRSQIGLALWVLLAAVPSWAQAPAQAPASTPQCSPPTYKGDLVANAAVVKPQGFTTATIANNLAEPIPEARSLGDVGEQWTQEQIDALIAAKDMLGSAALAWSDTASKKCVQGYAKPSAGTGGDRAKLTQESPATGALRRTFQTADSCGEAGEAWEQELSASNPGAHHTLLVFRDDLGLCYQSPLRPAQGAMIHVAVFTATPGVWDGVRAQFQPCSLQPATPAILTTGSIADLPGSMRTAAATAPKWMLRPYMPRQCWNQNVAITIQGEQRQIAYTLTQASRYRATFHLGTIFTENHEVTFGLRPDGTSNRVFAQGPTNRGPEYVGALVFYGLPHYVANLFGGTPYVGRDPVQDTNILDRIGGVVGLGLRNPLNSFVVGFSIELAAGVNVIVVRDFVKTNVLTGIKEGDVFTGTVEQIPIAQQWRGDKWVLGLTLDFVYASTAFKR